MTTVANDVPRADGPAEHEPHRPSAPPRTDEGHDPQGSRAVPEDRTTGSPAGDRPPWWSAGRFVGVRPRPLRHLLNTRFDDVCRQMGEVLDQGDDVPDEARARVRRDVVAATRHSSVTWVIEYAAGNVVGWITVASVLAAANTLLWVVHDREPWILVVLTLSALVALVGVENARMPTGLLLLAALAWCLVSAWLLLVPFDVGALVRVAAVVVAVAVTVGFLALGWLVTWAMPLYPGLLVLLVVNSVALYDAQGATDYLDTHVAPVPDDVLAGLFVGMTLGPVVGLAIVAVEALNQVALKVAMRLRLRAVPEAEFVQSAVWLLATPWGPSSTADDEVEPAAPVGATGHTSGGDAVPPSRDELVHRVDWLARVLETDVAGHLCRLDPRNRVALRESFERKAAVLHRWKRQLLLGEPGAVDEVTAAVWDAVQSAAARSWSELLEAEVDTSPIVRAGQRLLGGVRRILALAAAVGVAVVAYLNHDTEVAGTAVIGAAVLLLELVSPGSGSKFGNAVGEARSLTKNLKRGAADAG